MEGGIYIDWVPVIYSGDKKRALLEGWREKKGRQLLQKLIERNAYTQLGLINNQWTKTYSDGMVIIVSYVFFIPRIEIYLPPAKGEKEVELEEFQCDLYTDDPDNPLNPQIKTPIKFSVKDIISYKPILKRQGNTECSGKNFTATFDGGQCYYSNSNIRPLALNALYYPNYDWSAETRNPSPIRNGEIYGTWSGYISPLTGNDQSEIATDPFLRSLEVEYKVKQDIDIDLYRTTFWLNGIEYDTFEATGDASHRIVGVSQVSDKDKNDWVVFIVQPLRVSANLGASLGTEDIWIFEKSSGILTATKLETFTYSTTIYSHYKMVVNRWLFSEDGYTGIAYRPKMDQFGEYFDYEGHCKTVISFDKNNIPVSETEWIGTVSDALYAKDAATWTPEENAAYIMTRDTYWDTYVSEDQLPKYYYRLGIAPNFLDNTFDVLGNYAAVNQYTEINGSTTTYYSTNNASVVGTAGEAASINNFESNSIWTPSHITTTKTNPAAIWIIDAVPNKDFIIFFEVSYNWQRSVYDINAEVVTVYTETAIVKLKVYLKGETVQVGSPFTFTNYGAVPTDVSKDYAGVPYGFTTTDYSAYGDSSKYPEGFQSLGSALLSGGQNGGENKIDNKHQLIPDALLIQQAEIGGSYKLSRSGSHAVLSIPWGDFARVVYPWFNQNVANQYASANVPVETQDKWNKYVYNYAILLDDDGLRTEQLSDLLFGTNIVNDEDTTAFLPIGLYVTPETEDG